MHLNIVFLIIPYFVASGHIHYTIVSYIYVHDMYSLPNKMTKIEFDKYAAAYFTITRSNEFCSGASLNMVIKWTASREYKVVGEIV